MKIYLTAHYLLALTVLIFSACNGEKQQAETGKPVVLESLKIEKKAGPDCDKPDTLRMNCVEVSLSFPTIKEGSEPLKKAVSDWTSIFVVGMLDPSVEPDKIPAGVSLDSSVLKFIAFHHQSVTDSLGGSYYFMADLKDSVLLNDGKHLTLKLDSYTFTGGAHGSPYAAVATLETATGKKVELNDLVTDLNALQALAEKKFREVKAEIFLPMEDGSPGFTFDQDVFPFKLADNTGLTNQGIYFCYVPYEVTPYAFGFTEFVIPFDEIQSIRKD